MKITEKGFTLFEVLVSLFISGVALLGLAQMEVYILKTSQSSFNYTVATIRANSFVDAVWAECSSADGSYSTILNNWKDEVTAAGMTVVAPISSTYTSDTTVKISWTDPRFKNDDENNSLTLTIEFPYENCGV